MLTIYNKSQVANTGLCVHNKLPKLIKVKQYIQHIKHCNKTVKTDWMLQHSCFSYILWVCCMWCSRLCFGCLIAVFYSVVSTT